MIINVFLFIYIRKGKFKAKSVWMTSWLWKTGEDTWWNLPEGVFKIQISEESWY